MDNLLLLARRRGRLGRGVGHGRAAGAFASLDRRDERRRGASPGVGARRCALAREREGYSDASVCGSERQLVAHALAIELATRRAANVTSNACTELCARAGAKKSGLLVCYSR